MKGQGLKIPDNLENFEDDLWREAVPLPFYTSRWLLLKRYQCWHKSSARAMRCNLQFRTPRQYERHYLESHADKRVWRRTPIGNVERIKTYE